MQQGTGLVLVESGVVQWDLFDAAALSEQQEAPRSHGAHTGTRDGAKGGGGDGLVYT